MAGTVPVCEQEGKQMTCREKVKIIAPEAVKNTMIGGVTGCPPDYGIMDRPPYCEARESICNKCWDREIPSEEMEGKTVEEELKRLHILEGRIEAVRAYVESGAYLSVSALLTLLGIEQKKKGKADDDAG